MHESEKWKWSRSVVYDSSRPHGLQPTRLLRPWDFPGKSTGVGCHCLLGRQRLCSSYFTTAALAYVAWCLAHSKCSAYYIVAEPILWDHYSYKPAIGIQYVYPICIWLLWECPYFKNCIPMPKKGNFSQNRELVTYSISVRINFFFQALHDII